MTAAQDAPRCVSSGRFTRNSGLVAHGAVRITEQVRKARRSVRAVVRRPALFWLADGSDEESSPEIPEEPKPSFVAEFQGMPRKFEEETGIVAKAVGHALEHFDVVVDPLERPLWSSATAE